VVVSNNIIGKRGNGEMMEVYFDDDALRHYCAINIPEVSRFLRLDHLDHAINILNGVKCPLCESFDNSIRGAIMREAGKRIDNIPLVED